MSKMSELREANLAVQQAAKDEREAADAARLEAYLAEKAAAEADPNSRRARCGCGVEVASHSGLAFLESAERLAQGSCRHCGYADVAHVEPVRSRPHLKSALGDGHEFTQREPAAYDTFYCGCRGWD